jgi:hypothetical protein
MLGCWRLKSRLGGGASRRETRLRGFNRQRAGAPKRFGTLT